MAQVDIALTFQLQLAAQKGLQIALMDPKGVPWPQQCPDSDLVVQGQAIKNHFHSV